MTPDPQTSPDRAPIGWDGMTLKGMLDRSDQLFSETGRYQGLNGLQLKKSEPIRYERMYSRMRGAGLLHGMLNRRSMCGLTWLPSPSSSLPREWVCRSLAV